MHWRLRRVIGIAFSFYTTQTPDTEVSNWLQDKYSHGVPKIRDALQRFTITKLKVELKQLIVSTAIALVVFSSCSRAVTPQQAATHHYTDCRPVK